MFKMWLQKIRIYLLVGALIILFGYSDAMTRQQLKNSGKLMKKTCMPKNDVTEDVSLAKYTLPHPYKKNPPTQEIGKIEQGMFIEDRKVMCYIACVYSMTQLVKNNKLSYDAIIKQVDMMFPPDMRVAVKAAAEHCKDNAKKYKDICEASYWTAKCMYEFDPENFMFP